MVTVPDHLGESLAGADDDVEEDAVVGAEIERHRITLCSGTRDRILELGRPVVGRLPIHVGELHDPDRGRCDAGDRRDHKVEADAVEESAHRGRFVLHPRNNSAALPDR